MANQNKPNGLKPHGQMLRLRPYVAGSTCYPGDAVALAADGQVDAASTGAFLGVCATYATAGQTVMVYDDPNQLFEVQADGAIASTDVGLNATLAGSANSQYKRSGQYIDSTTKATTSTLSLQILGSVSEANNTANAAYNDVVCRINVHQLASAGLTGV